MLELAEVVGLEEHLTVPSRGHGQLVDLWIAIKRSSAGLEWERQFTRIAQSSNVRLSPAGFFQALPFTERRGWIVARCADGKKISATAVEDLVRALVAEVNARVSAPVPVAAARLRSVADSESWTEKVRTAFATGSALIAGPALSAHRDRDVDIASR